MDQQLLVIFLILILIVLMVCLILKKNKVNEPFHGSSVVCDEVKNTDICENEFSDSCRVVGGQCRYKCNFNPKEVTAKTADAYGMKAKSVDDPTLEFKDKDDPDKGEDVRGSATLCFEKCVGIDDTDPEDRDKEFKRSYCSRNDCTKKCGLYAHSKSDTDISNVRYENYPTDKISEEKYEEIKETILSKMVEDEYRSKIKGNIFKEEVDQEISNQEELQKNVSNLSQIMNKLNDLNSSGNNFVQQVNQIGEFQDKYSQKIESLLNEKKQTGESIDIRIESMSKKIEELNKLYSGYFDGGIQNIEDDIKRYYKMGTSLANGQKIYFTPVKYNIGTDENPEFKFFKNGAYLVNLDKNGPVTNFLYIEPLILKEDGTTTYCNPNNLSCLYKLTKGTDRGEEEISTVNINNDIIGEQYPADITEDKSKFVHKKHAYFNLIEVKNNDEYNAIIINTPNGSRNLVSNEVIKYPFFVIESVELPGYLLNIITNTDGTHSLILNPADKRGTEKFTLDSIQTGIPHDNCSI